MSKNKTYDQGWIDGSDAQDEADHEIIKQLQAENEHLKIFKSLACEMYTQKMIIVCAACDIVEEQALKGGVNNE
ncbi:hypothetical protein LCGC14_2342870 [marine sediment metagenome]|uniref:Uncharacterized protein n=1 Tax=marine sediment metagenome TaxID=412755 RepID=A0A0F9CBD2_9ZZZZ